MSQKKTIALWYPAFMGGGAESVALWMLEALKEDYDVTLFTITQVDLNRLNSMYGTQLSEESVKVRSLSSQFARPLVHNAIANNKNFRMLGLHILIRYLKSQQQHYDLAISAYNATDLGDRGIQYVHWVNVVEGNAFYQKISGFSRESLKRNISIANSHFVAQRAKREYGIESTIVYPPVVLESPNMSWEEKENAFICSGRLTKAKEPHRVIQILKRVRQKGFDVKLYLTGGGGGTYAWKYRRFLQKMVDENADWVTPYENLKYQDYINVLCRCRYGIHYKKEPFGISIAEMLKAGSIPFVRSKGGQVEIIGEENQALFFDSVEEAEEKIISVLKDTQKQQQLLSVLDERKSLFSTERFMSGVQAVVGDYFER
ncbi:glycosyltransferase [Lusitaniella coriacea LEGE 07157]|uniref:Glycosyltransferase n=1 Tax=Lusitaniella coriacea LEGE 07157 TaxID=945747 RepID=A0A8J7DWF4_9CYAN|nr:glycosyltransferase [Lusitaniella coriacea]MBE9116436.1 glycosyltransferase [Lusitaniella coriacea LEGE 07157]